MLCSSAQPVKLLTHCTHYDLFGVHCTQPFIIQEALRVRVTTAIVYRDDMCLTIFLRVLVLQFSGDMIDDLEVGTQLRSSEFYCSGYNFKIGLLWRKGFLAAGLLCEGPRASWLHLGRDCRGSSNVGDSSNNGEWFLDTEHYVDLDRCRLAFMGRDGLELEMTSVPGLFHVGRLECPIGFLKGVCPQELVGPARSELLTEKGFLWDGDVHLQAVIMVGKGLTR